jgi:hypothetical protein
VLLFKKRFWEGLTSGAVTLTFRRWQKPHVRVGGRYRCHPIGVLEVDAVAVVPASSVTEADANRSGFASLGELVEHLAELGPLADDSPLYRVELHHGGDGDRVELALEEKLTDKDIETISKKLKKLDGRKPWTMDTLKLIKRRPRVAAKKLALSLGREKLPFKEDVRRLKRLGLTQSFEVGYEVSPRGKAYLAAAAKVARQKKPSGRAAQSKKR